MFVYYYLQGFLIHTKVVGNNENRKICSFFSLFTLQMLSGCLLCGSSMLDAEYINVPAVSGPTVDRETDLNALLTQT